MWIARKNGLNPATFLGRRKQGVPGTLGSRHHLGRGALYRILSSLRLKSGDEVLVPAYLCDTAVQPILDLDVTCRFYRLDSTLNADMADMDRNISSDTRAVIVVHYFGFPQPMETIRKFCDEHDLQLVEDCAHVLPADHRDGAPGTWGDCVFFSLRKHLPIPGAAPALRAGGALIPFELRPPGGGLMFRHVTADILAFAGSALGFRRGWPKRSTDITSPAGKDSRIKLYRMGMHGISRHLMERLDFERIAHLRRRNYRHMLESVPWSDAVTPLFPGLPEGIVPLWLPVRTDDARRMSRCLTGVDAFVWPALHPMAETGEDAACQQARQLREELLLLPVHEGLGAKDLDHVCARLERALLS